MHAEDHERHDQQQPQHQVDQEHELVEVVLVDVARDRFEHGDADQIGRVGPQQRQQDQDDDKTASAAAGVIAGTYGLRAAARTLVAGSDEAGATMMTSIIARRTRLNERHKSAAQMPQRFLASRRSFEKRTKKIRQPMIAGGAGKARARIGNPLGKCLSCQRGFVDDDRLGQRRAGLLGGALPAGWTTAAGRRIRRYCLIVRQLGTAMIGEPIAAGCSGLRGMSCAETSAATANNIRKPTLITRQTPLNAAEEKRDNFTVALRGKSVNVRRVGSGRSNNCAYREIGHGR